MQFAEQTFTVTETWLSSETRQREVTGTIAPDTGLGYYFDGEHYAPTHLASGFNLGLYFFDEQDIQKWIEAIVPLTDWEKPAAIFFEPTYIGEVVPLMKEALLRITHDYVTLKHREALSRISREYALSH